MKFKLTRGPGSARSTRLAVIHSRLFRKYAAVFTGVLGVALVANGAFEIWSSLQQRKDLLLRNQRQQAVEAGGKIEQFIGSVQSELRWMTVRSWSADTLQAKYLDALWLLRRAPAITEVTEIDASGHEELNVSRLSMDVVGGRTDRSRDPDFTEAVAHQAYFGPVYFRHGSEPYMTISVSTELPRSEVNAAETNLKFIWDVVSKIKVGEHGYAYVVDNKGNLIAHPEINFVLRHTNLSQLAQVKAARAGGAPVEVAKNILGRSVLTAYARITPLDWLVFVELPTGEAYAPLYQSAFRSGLILIVGLMLAITAGMILARRMVMPIQALSAGASRFGGGDLDQRIEVHTGDELEALAYQFNDMAGKLQDSYVGLERKVEERTRQLEIANLAKSRFIAAASHDLRQPLQALDLFVAQLHSGQSAAERRRIIERIGIAVAEMNDLFDALLDISKLDAGVVAPSLGEFPIASLLTRIETTFVEAAREKGLSFRVVTSRAWVRSDQRLLERILLNLASNAIRYTFRGGVVVGCRRHANMLRIDVCDTGPGVSDDQRQRIFDEFYRVEAKGQWEGGLGLGLAIVDRLSKLLGQRVSLTSTVGKGSRFSVTVPRIPAQRLKKAPRDIATDIPKDKLVVIIDDETLILDAMGGLLRNWGCRVVTARTCSAVLAELGIERQPDLIISDYHLADRMTGDEAIERVRRAFRSTIPAFLISGDTSPERLRLARAQGFFLLYKPVSPMALRAAVSHLLWTGRAAERGIESTIQSAL